MITIGYQALNVALVLSLYAAILYFVVGNNSSSKYLRSAHRASMAVLVLVAVASIALEYALFAHDFRIEYVANYSNRALSWFYTMAAFWAGQAGSLLFWCLLLTIYAAIVLAQNRRKYPDLLPYTMGVLQVTIFFFLYLLVFKTGPFARLPFTPEDGRGLNPLLQNIEMVFHPPALYIGFVGYTVPFAFAIAALITGRLENRWLSSIRRWALFSWLFLTIGNILGMQWAYVELGWGGYWAWDPVENSSLLPWLTGTAFLHSIIVQERKGVLKGWTIALIVITFALTIFGTFVTRSGLIASVHAFGVSDLGPLFLGFLALILIVSTILLNVRAPLLKGRQEIGAWTAKESGFLLNNLLFSAMAVGVLIGVLTPTLSELFTGQPLSVGEEWFNRVAAPIGIAIFALIGVCTALSWGKTSAKRLLHNMLIPAAISGLVTALLIVMGVRGFAPLLSLAIAVFAISTIIQDSVRAARVHAEQKSKNCILAFFSLILKQKRRYGAAIVHLGVLCFFIGIVGSSAFISEQTATVQKGTTIDIGDYELLFTGLSRARATDRIIDAAHFVILKNGQEIDVITSEKLIFENFQPATEVGIRSTLKQDIYVILADYDMTADIATVTILINPLVLWIWLGGIIMVLGTLLAMAPASMKKSRRSDMLISDRA
ncbi:heme lyase CcmF/NrfE family subunit [candidate division KSB1 bacterium]|nr:heme lyase CcmF/NrfE family subunit [candidate division KSB1 bacterium]RQW11041.1 MAG: heme lyase CcmF/NrfE family subunit [candidate division KSB1 bacterium]